MTETYIERAAAFLSSGATTAPSWRPFSFQAAAVVGFSAASSGTLSASVVTPYLVQADDYPAYRHLTSLRRFGWHLVYSSILVKVERDTDGEYLVSDHFSTVYGNGTTEEAAIDDYCTSLLEYYEILQDCAVQNAPTRLALQRLRNHIQRS